MISKLYLYLFTYTFLLFKVGIFGYYRNSLNLLDQVSFLLVKVPSKKTHSFRYTKPEADDFDDSFDDDFDDDGCKSCCCFSNDFDDDAKKRQRVVGLV